jgi:hypothetical protein
MYRAVAIAAEAGGNAPGITGSVFHAGFGLLIK